MANSNALVLLDTGRAGTRLAVLSQELLHAWDRTEPGVARQWGLSSAGLFATALKRRVGNLFELAARLSTVSVAEGAAAARAYHQDRLSSHLGDRLDAAHSASTQLVVQVKAAASQVAQLLREHPRDAAPQLLVLVATSIVVSGGPDGDGGAPDLDLLLGVGAHRSVFTHSILMGAALEAGFLSLVELVVLIHRNLPQLHDPLWDSLARHAGPIALAASTGASIGLAYHLLVDGLAQPAAYHGIPVPLPIEMHQAIATGNGLTEGLDTALKPAGAAPGWRAATSAEVQDGFAASDVAPAPGRPGSVKWRMGASAADIADEQAAHYRLLEQATLVDSFVADMLADEELLIIEQRGCWLAALANGEIRPLSVQQDHFVAATRGEVATQTMEERVWLTYQGLLAFAPDAH